MVYNVCAKMTIFHKLDVIDVGIEVVPIKEFADEMSTGVSYFEQFVWDLEQRGVSDNAQIVSLPTGDPLKLRLDIVDGSLREFLTFVRRKLLNRP